MNTIIAELILYLVFWFISRFFSKRALENVNEEYRSKSNFELLSVLLMRKRYFNKVGWKYAIMNTYWLPLLFFIAFIVVVSNC